MGKDLKTGKWFGRQYTGDDDEVDQLIDDQDQNDALVSLLVAERQRLMEINKNLARRANQDPIEADEEASTGYSIVNNIKELQRANRKLNNVIGRTSSSAIIPRKETALTHVSRTSP